ncbi:molybdate ABC transporter substrate-binding protein [Ferrimonas lipolytica]|uniref:Molybdate ABC transporter substrate-binding protein n=1 Tax=Ferrimonas lipolytica TaxID=2724191 RepID=A0A6H1UIA2_9GAMM|nr:molybdate ABC transporter substrate-binding protein [Ferrimonas lipolytica]QIZ78043.1 molybdate ABC transporter substrate-binding protein [Ferrimonas lipolytica]
MDRLAVKGLLLSTLLGITTTTTAAELRVAVAANFKHTLELIAADYQQQTGVKVRLSAGSTGALYTQIRHGAPYDLYFAADIERPKLLEQQQLIRNGSRITYAVGVLAFWTPGQLASNELLAQWQPRLSIANPRTAPYGVAAEQSLQQVRPNDFPPLVRGSNILQAFQYVQSGNATGGLVAMSHLKAEQVATDEFWPIPPNWHDPIEQQGVVLSRTTQVKEACSFLRYVAQANAQLEHSGYLTHSIDGVALEQQCLSAE